jgi:hypothetical protein
MGRKKLNINWVKVEKMAMAGANGKQISSALGIHYDTLTTACVRENKSTFSDYLQAKREKGNNFLLSKQYDIAIEGDRSMLIWLGKNRLGQSDKKEVISENKNVQTYDLSNLTDEELKQLAKLSATITVDTSGTSQTDIS